MTWDETKYCLTPNERQPPNAFVALVSVMEITGRQLYFPFMERTGRRASVFERRKARDVAQAALDGRTTVLEAARALVSLAHTDAVPDVEDRKLIIAVESETDHLPVGEVRKFWAPDALKEKDAEIARAETLYREAFLQACERIATTNCSSD